MGQGPVESDKRTNLNQPLSKEERASKFLQWLGLDETQHGSTVAFEKLFDGRVFNKHQLGIVLEQWEQASSFEIIPARSFLLAELEGFLSDKKSDELVRSISNTLTEHLLVCELIKKSLSIKSVLVRRRSGQSSQLQNLANWEPNAKENLRAELTFEGHKLELWRYDLNSQNKIELHVVRGGTSENLKYPVSSWKREELEAVAFDAIEKLRLPQGNSSYAGWLSQGEVLFLKRTRGILSDREKRKELRQFLEKIHSPSDIDKMTLPTLLR